MLLFKERFLHSNFYFRLRYNFPFYYYWDLKERKRVHNEKVERLFYRKALQGEKGPLVFDIGAHIGEKTLTFLKLGARVVCVEPDPLHARIITQRFYSKRRVVVVNKAVSDSCGNETMFFLQEYPSFNTLSRKWKENIESPGNKRLPGARFEYERSIETVTIDKLILTYGLPFYIKIDVEGYEKKALLGLSQPVPLLSFEANLPEFREETIDSIERFAS